MLNDKNVNWTNVGYACACEYDVFLMLQSQPTVVATVLWHGWAFLQIKFHTLHYSSFWLSDFKFQRLAKRQQPFSVYYVGSMFRKNHANLIML